YAVPRLLDADGFRHLADWAATILGLDRDTILERLTRNADKAFVWLKRHLTEDEEAAIAETIAQTHVLGLRCEMVRLYPKGRELANVIGFTDIDGNGLEGLERHAERWLAGEDGRTTRM